MSSPPRNEGGDVIYAVVGLSVEDGLRPYTCAFEINPGGGGVRAPHPSRRKTERDDLGAVEEGQFVVKHASQRGGIATSL